MVVFLWWFKCKDFSYITSRLGCFQLYNFSLVFVVVFVWRCSCGGVFVVEWWCFMVYMQRFQLYNFPARLLSAI